ncbi:bifunctional DNA primase/polymerase [Streptomyces sp. NPDC056500]|uniref:bifunctional DNA primase/polymerase n=1 Tax=Streptomyces sp. NPDC056500 TaxID=3345840 RepID=UPI0036847AF1
MATIDRQTAALALAHALFAAERGLPVIPLSSNKLPALRSPHRDDVEPTHCRGECGLPGHGIHDATVDPAGIRALFAAAPWATGYGIACGRPPHHLIGVDLDVKPLKRRSDATPRAGTHPPGAPESTGPPERAREHPPTRGPLSTWAPASASSNSAPSRSGNSTRSLAALAAMEVLGTMETQESTTDSLAALHHLALRHLFTIPETITVLTPSGGRHLWLTGPSDVVVPNSASRIAPGIDVRGAGGYLVGPGSVTAQGTYRLAPGTAGLSPAPCPTALLQLIAPPVRPLPTAPAGAHRQHGRGLVQFVLAAPEGQRNARLFWAACRAYENGIGNALAPALTHAAVRTGLTEREARATIASAARLTSSPRH